MTITLTGRKSDGTRGPLPYKIFEFPGGELHVSASEDVNLEDYETLVVDVRGHQASDVIALSLLGDLFDHSYTCATTVLLLPYLPAARADRGLPFGADVYSKLINKEAWDHIVCVDPHSPVAPKLYGAVEYPFERIIRNEIQDPTQDTKNLPYVGVIAPDKGAVDRATRAAKVMGVPVYRAEKSRDFETGKLSGFHMIDDLPEEGKLLLVDDICDGGGTFIGLAEATGLTRDRIDLWVTHGIFSKGLEELHTRFGAIHTTDSYTSRDELVAQHSLSHDIFELTNDPSEGGFVHIHKLSPYLATEVNRFEG